MNRIQIEVCLEHHEDALAVQSAGATRIELNSSLNLDGLTPSLAACRWLKANCQLPVIAMLRSHNDGFFVDSETQKNLVRDCELLLEAGADGIAYGAVDATGKLNINYFSEMAAICGAHDLVCHRAFDTLSDPLLGLEQLIDCGVHRILTSGGARTAEQGIELLRTLVEHARDRIEILPGSGISAGNALRILQTTGCRQLHGTFRLRGTPLERESIRTNIGELKAVCEVASGFLHGLTR